MTTYLEPFTNPDGTVDYKAGVNLPADLPQQIADLTKEAEALIPAVLDLCKRVYAVRLAHETADNALSERTSGSAEPRLSDDLVNLLSASTGWDDLHLVFMVLEDFVSHAIGNTGWATPPWESELPGYAKYAQGGSERP